MINNFSYIYPTATPDYVGLRIENGKPKFIFPCDYIKDTQISEDQRKQDMLNLLKVIDKYKDITQVDDSSLKRKNFPFESLLWIIRNFIENGYYQITESEYRVGSSGKVNWKKTIKNNEIFLDTDSIIYRELIVKYNKNNVENIITNIHKYIVYVSIYVMGWYYDIDVKTIYKPPQTMSKTNILHILRQEYNKSFTDYKKELIRHMINVLEGLDENRFNTNNYDISTNHFEYVFERLINEKFGNADSSKFNPKCYWKIDDKPNKASTLRPDTILIYSKNAYIIDAKYYKYGYNFDKRYLPEASSIQKQITYAEEFETNFKDSYKINNIYNVFILPYSSKNYLKYIGYAYSSWNNIDTKTYYKIYAFLVDLRSLVNGKYENSQIQLVNKLNEEINKNFYR